MITVCRLLAALDNELGPLSARVLDVLSIALDLEEFKANTSEILLNDVNCKLFETVNEKLKGHLIADVLEPQKVKAVEKSVRYIAKLVHQASNLNHDSNSLASLISTDEKVEEPVDDREKFAKEIAETLILVEKTDISSEELEVLIDAIIEAKEKENAEEPTPPRITITPEKQSSVDEKMSAKEFIQLNYLTDEDLQTLLRNFQALTDDEQNHLIAFLRKLKSKIQIVLRSYENM